jgi:hypothetical protein
MATTTHWAVVVGIDQYPAFDNLRCARRDAQSFMDWVRDPNGGGLQVDHTILITEELPANCTEAQAKPTRDMIFDAIEKCFQAADAAVRENPALWHETRLYLYFSGHGIANSPSDAALLAANANKNNPGRHVSCQSLQDFFTIQPYFRDLVIFADCCRDNFSGKVNPSFPPWLIGDQVGGGSPRVFFGCATEFGRKAYEEQDGPEEYRRGYFTRCLLEALNSRKDSALTLPGDDLKKRIKGLLASLCDLPNAPRGGFNFTPYCVNEDEIHFRVTGNAPKYMVKIATPPSTSHVRISHTSGTYDMIPSADADAFEARVPLGIYDVEMSTDGGNTFYKYQEPITLIPGYNERRLTS